MEGKIDPNIRCRLDSARRWRGFAALALVLSVVLFAPLPTGIAKPPPPPPERDVTIEFVRVLPPGGAYAPDAVRLDQLDPAVQATLRAGVADPEVNLYEVLRKQTIHLGEPQLVRINARLAFEFRRVGVLGKWVECASVADGVARTWSDVPPEELFDGRALCAMQGWNSDVYAVAWVRRETPAPSR
jgi:hypothetical protein